MNRFDGEQSLRIIPLEHPCLAHTRSVDFVFPPLKVDAEGLYIKTLGDSAQEINYSFLGFIDTNDQDLV